jgi:hypothetical protein
MRVLSTVFVFALAGCSGGGADDTTTTFTPVVGNKFSAAHFIEGYCSGCHQSGYTSPSGRPVAFFTTDPNWTGPFANRKWASTMDYKMVVKWGDAIRCGVNPSELPDSCASLPEVVPGFFSKPEKFPPPGDLAPGEYGGGTPPAVCVYAEDGHTCPQPSLKEREGMIRWMDEGFPE